MLLKTSSFPAVARVRARLAGRVEPASTTTTTEPKRLGGLVLTRHLGQSIMVGQATEVEVVGIKSGTVRLRINAPRDLAIHRREVFRAIQANPRPAGMDDHAHAHARNATSGRGALVLTRHREESIMIGDDVEVIVDDVRPSAVRLRIVAPRQVQVHRREVFDEIQLAVDA